MVTFPIIKTSKAFSGCCWLSFLDTEQSFAYATRQRGADQSKSLEVDVIGINNDKGPFKWVGMPAYRIPVGGSYAHPAPEILQELLGDGTHTDLQFNFYDKFDAFTADGLLRYHWKAEVARG